MHRYTLIVSALLLTAGCSQAPETTTTASQESEPVNYTRLSQLEQAAPVANQVEYQAEYHGLTLSDPYHWLKDQGYPEIDDQPVLDYLNLENDYYYSWLEPHRPLADTLFEEFKGRLDETETSVPWQKDGYEYRWEFREGDDYRTWLWRNLDGGEEQVLLSEPELAEGHEYFVLGSWDISSDYKLLAYSVDTAGDERYQLYVKNLVTGEVTQTGHNDIRGNVLFGKDNQTLVYAQLEQERWFVRSINVHQLGTEIDEDKVIFTEQDDGFFAGFGMTSSEEYLLINSSQAEINEVVAVPAGDLFAEPVMLKSREQEFNAGIDHANGYFYIRANDTHVNSRLARVFDAEPAYDSWETIIEGSDTVYLRGMKTFSDFVVVQERNNGIDQVRIMPNDGEAYYVEFPEPVYRASISTNPDFKQQHVRISYESMITPDTVFDYHLESAELETRKVDKIPSGYDGNQYVTERLMAPARDGAMIPVSIVYKKGFKKDGSHPLSLYGYGAYGVAMSPSFSTMRLSILDRGFAYAIAHVRGGDEMGYQWYLDGKLDKRQNTFNDFVDVANFLVEQNYTSAGNISISGRSAGGELVGAAVIQAPDLWRSAILGVPFVDVLNTMLDASLPLTPPEWKEWGNPIESKEHYELILSYSPYDNIQAREYPPMMVTGGLNDPRVTYWEPAKWTAKMRATKTDENLLIMRINMGAGHFSNSGRYGRLKDYAEEYAFQLLAHGISE